MKSKQKSIKLNFLMNSILSMSNIIFPIITFPYISRVLTPEGTGKISTALSVIAFFNIFAQLGIPTYGVRACAIVRDDKEELSKTAHELLFINIIMSIFMYAVLFASIVFIPAFRQEKTLYIITSLTIMLSSVGMEWLYKALEQYSYITVRSVIFKLIAIILMFILVHSREDYVIYGGISIFASSASSLLNFINARKYIDFKVKRGYNLKKHLKPAMIFLGMSCAATIYTSRDKVMLKFMTNDNEAGLYDAAIKIKNSLMSIVTSLGAVLLPRVSYYIENKMMDEFVKVTRKAFNFVVVFSAAATIYFIVMARQCIILASGPLYEGSILPMRIIMPTVFIVGLSNVLGVQMLIPLGREKELLIAEIGGAIIDIIINAIFILPLRSSGAAIGTLVAEIFVNIYFAYALRNELKGTIRGIRFDKVFASLMIATSSMLVIYHFFKMYFENIIVDFVSHRLLVSKGLEEICCFCELAVTFSVFSIIYFGLLILFRESFCVDIIYSLRDKFVDKVFRKEK